MTMPKVVSAQVATPADGPLARVRSPTGKGGAEDGAHAEFGAHLAGMTADKERTSKTVAGEAKGRDRPAARWRHREDDEAQLPLDRRDSIVGSEAMTANAATAAGTDGQAARPATGVALLVSDLAAATAPIASVPTGPKPALEPTAVAADQKAKAGALRGAIVPRPQEASADGPQLPAAPERLPGMQRADLTGRTNEGPRRVQEVVVLGRETHLAPATLQAAASAKLQARPQATAPEGSAPWRPASGDMDQTMSVPVSDPRSAHPFGAKDASRFGDASRIPSMLQSQRGADPAPHGEDDAEPSASSSPARPAPAEASQRAQSRTAGDPLGVARSGQIEDAGRLRQEDQASASPAPALSLPRQVAEQIVADLATAPEPSTAPAAAPATAPGPQPLRVITIQLHPVELGTLTVRISLKNDALELQVEATRRETARLVDSDRETLSGLLRSAGYHVEAMTVRAVEPPGAAAALGSAPGAPDGAPQPQSGGAQAEQRPSGGQARAGQDRDMHGTRRNITVGEDGASRRAGRGLYI